MQQTCEYTKRTTCILHKLLGAESVLPVTVAERSNFARSEAGIVGSNPKQSMDVWYVYVFILCLCYRVFK
jgi:hypothetical protein